MNSWGEVAREGTGEGSVPFGETWHRGNDVERPRVGPSGPAGPPGAPSSRGARRASSDHASVPIPLVSWSAQGRRRNGGRLGEARRDIASGGYPLRSPADRQDGITVVVCDHLPVLARGLARLLEEEPPHLRVAAVETSLEDARRSIAEVRPLVAVIGLSSERVQEFKAVREICSAFPATRVVVLLSEGEVPVVSSELAGASVAGYALKEREAAEIADVVNLVARGHVVAPAAVAFSSERRTDRPPLDDMEWEILKGVAQSETNRELAARLHVSERTICRRLEGIYAKLDLADRLQAAVFAVTHGLVTRATWRGGGAKMPD